MKISAKRFTIIVGCRDSGTLIDQFTSPLFQDISKHPTRDFEKNNKSFNLVDLHLLLFYYCRRLKRKRISKLVQGLMDNESCCIRFLESLYRQISTKPLVSHHLTVSIFSIIIEIHSLDKGNKKKVYQKRRNLLRTITQIFKMLMVI